MALFPAGKGIGFCAAHDQTTARANPPVSPFFKGGESSLASARRVLTADDMAFVPPVTNVSARGIAFPL